jgi:hypothetical protein
VILTVRVGKERCNREGQRHGYRFWAGLGVHPSPVVRDSLINRNHADQIHANVSIEQKSTISKCQRFCNAVSPEIYQSHSNRTGLYTLWTALPLQAKPL